MPAPLLLGIDVGTAYCKAAVVSADGRELTHGRAPTRWRSVETGAEIDAQDLLAAVRSAARAALAALASPGERPPAIAGVGVASIAETGVLLDGRGRPVAPLIAWHDARGQEEAAALSDALGADAFSMRTGLRPGPTPSIAKLAWLHGHVPAAREAVRWLDVASLVVRELGGRDVAELSLASRTGLLDQGTRDWWPDGLAAAGLTRAALPPLVPAGEHCGIVGKGLLPGCDGAALTVAGHDHLAAAVGAGAVRDGDVLDSFGTAEALVRAVAGPLPPEEILRAVRGRVTVGVHVVPGRLALLAGLAGGLLLRRVLALLGIDDAGRGALSAAALTAPPNAGRIVFGEGALDGVRFEGIDPTAAPGVAWRAALEHVERETAGRLAGMEAIAGPRERLVAVGGWLLDPAVRRVKEEILGPFEMPPVAEAGARGAALIGGVAAGLFADALAVPAPTDERGAGPLGSHHPTGG